MVVELYTVGLVAVGLTLLGVGVLPRFIGDRAVSMPIFFVGFGVVLFSLPFVPFVPDPLEQGESAEHLAEFGVIIALMALGLKIDRRPGIAEWSVVWRLLAVTMPLSIAGAALLGWWTLGLVVPTAVLLGAVIAPTDPVLASEAQVGEPGKGFAEDHDRPEDHEKEVRFALSTEAGLNDGLAFPFTNLAIALALVGLAPSNWLGEWLLVDVVYKIAVGTLAGIVLGWILARIIFITVPETQVANSVQGIEALAGTLIAYGATEVVGGYGFIAVFVAATMVRNYERTHEYNDSLHDVTEFTEQAVMALIMVLFGGALVGGLLEPLTTEAIVVALVIVFVLRPLAGFVGLLGSGHDRAETAAIAFFGIRGLGSFYYLSYGLNHGVFPDADMLWALVGVIVLISIVVHGISATPVMSLVESE